MSTLKILTRKDLDGVQDITYEDVDMRPFGWPGAVRVQMLRGSERSAFENDVLDQRRGGSTPAVNVVLIREKLVARCLIDPETGERLYTDMEIGELAKRNAAAIEFLFETCQRMNRLSKQDVETLAENFSVTPAAGSISA